MSTPGFKFVYDPELAGFELAPDHPFKPLRFEITRTLLMAVGLLADTDLVSPTPLDDDDILMIHDRRFVEAVRSVTVASRAVEAPRISAARAADEKRVMSGSL